MVPRKDFTSKVDASSTIAKYVNNLSDRRYIEEKERYEEQEPQAKYNSWEEFVRIAISRQYLGGKGWNATVQIRNGDKILLRTGNWRNWLRFGRSDDWRLKEAIANLVQRARDYTRNRDAEIDEDDFPEKLRGQKQKFVTQRSSHHTREEEEALHGHNEHSKVHHSASHHQVEADQDDGSWRRKQLRIEPPPPTRSHIVPTYQEEDDDTPLLRRGYSPSCPQEIVVPAPPPVTVTVPTYPSEQRNYSYRRSSRTLSLRAPHDTTMSGGLQKPDTGRPTSAIERESAFSGGSSYRASEPRGSERRKSGRLLSTHRNSRSYRQRWIDDLDEDEEDTRDRSYRRRDDDRVSRGSLCEDSGTYSIDRSGEDELIDWSRHDGRGL